MGELVSPFDPTDQPPTDEGGTGGGGDVSRPEDPWIIPGGLAKIWPEALNNDWTEVGLIVKGPEDYEP